MGWDWVKVLKEEMLDLKSDEHLSRHAATDRLAWVSSQAPARAPSPVDERDYPPNTPPVGGALLGFDDHVPDASRSPLSGFNAGPLYGGADDVHQEREDGVGQRREAAAGPAGSADPPTGRPELPDLNAFDFAMPTAPPLEYPAGHAPGGFGSPMPGASILSNPPPAASPFGGPPAPAVFPSGLSSPPPVGLPPVHAAPPVNHAPDPSAIPGLNTAAAQGGYGQSGYGDGGFEQGYVLTLQIDGVLAGVALPGGGEVTVGRERPSTLVIPESKQTVSRRAATLVRAGQRAVEARIENRNGAWVTRQLPEGTRQEFVERGRSVTLRIGDRLALDPPGTVIVGLGEPH